MPTTSPVTVTRVSDALWTAALAQAGGDPRRLRVISATEVIVVNAEPARRKRTAATPKRKPQLTVGDAIMALSVLDSALPLGDAAAGLKVTAITARDGAHGAKYAHVETGPWHPRRKRAHGSHPADPAGDPS